MSHAQRARVGPYTWDDFVALGEDDLRELIDGELVEVEVPKLPHEHVVARLVYFLTGWAMRRGALVLPSGYKIRVGERRGVMPDVQMYRKGNEPDPSQEEGLVRGRPDLVIEVMSPSSRRYDRIVKLGYYASLRVPECWLVDPVAETLERLVLEKKGYVTAAVLEGAATFSPAAFPGLRIALAKVWPESPHADAVEKRSVSRARRRTGRGRCPP